MRVEEVKNKGPSEHIDENKTLAGLLPIFLPLSSLVMDNITSHLCSRAGPRTASSLLGLTTPNAPQVHDRHRLA